VHGIVQYKDNQFVNVSLKSSLSAFIFIDTVDIFLKIAVLKSFIFYYGKKGNQNFSKFQGGNQPTRTMNNFDSQLSL